MKNKNSKNELARDAQFCGCSLCSHTKLAGFSLVEMIVAMAVFLIIITATLASFASVMNARKKAGEIQKNLSSGRAAMEQMAKNIRMSSYLEGSGATSAYIRMFNNSQSRCMGYRFLGGALEAAIGSYIADPSTVNSATCDNPGSYYPIVSGINLTGKFKIDRTNVVPGSLSVGKATILMKMGDDYLQTSVSFRDYEGSI